MKLDEATAKQRCRDLGLDPMHTVPAPMTIWLPNSSEKFAVEGRTECLVFLWQVIQRAAG